MSSTSGVVSLRIWVMYIVGGSGAFADVGVASEPSKGAGCAQELLLRAGEPTAAAQYAELVIDCQGC